MESFEEDFLKKRGDLGFVSTCLTFSKSLMLEPCGSR